MKTELRYWLSVMIISISFGEACQTMANAETGIINCAESSTCLSLFNTARQESAKGNLSEALRLYKSAYSARADPALLFSIARVLHKQGLVDEAVTYYQNFIDSPLKDSTQKERAKEYLAQLRPLLVPQRNPNQVSLNPSSHVVQIDPFKMDAQPAKKTPLYKRWWFWTLIGATAAGVAVAIGVSAAQDKPISGLPEFYPFQ